MTKSTQTHTTSWNPDISIWLSVDPLSDKYPSLSPYNYCANNPIKYVDPDGREIEHNSFKDKIYTTIARVFSSEFRNNYKELKASEETYVFKSNKLNNSSFTTDGDKLYVNFSSKKASKSQGDNWYSDLKHETEHAMQFEYGEFGFYGAVGSICGEGNFWAHGWEAINFDLHDEVKARDAGYRAFIFSGNYEKNIKNGWRDPDMTTDDKIQQLKNSPKYNHLPEGPINNSNKEKVKNNIYFMLPNRERK